MKLPIDPVLYILGLNELFSFYILELNELLLYILELIELLSRAVPWSARSASLFTYQNMW